MTNKSEVTKVMEKTIYRHYITLNHTKEIKIINYSINLYH